MKTASQIKPENPRLVQLSKMFLAVFLILILINNYIVLPAEAQTESFPVNIDATIKISVCGDGVAEGREECDMEDHRELGCPDFGYAKGFLICDTSCMVDYSNCYEKIVPPVNEDDGEGSTDGDGDDDETDDDNETGGQPGMTEEVLINVSRSLKEYYYAVSPKKIIVDALLDHFDRDQNGIIDRFEGTDLVKAWVSKWKTYLAVNLLDREKGDCDLNDDYRCNIIDFSILMYHIEGA